MVNDWTHSLSADISSAEDHFTAVPDQWITDCRPDKTTDEWSCHTMYMPTATLRMTEILAISHPLRGRLPRSGWQTTKRAACRRPSYLPVVRHAAQCMSLIAPPVPPFCESMVTLSTCNMPLSVIVPVNC